jgi:hypothetical protein
VLLLDEVPADKMTESKEGGDNEEDDTETEADFQVNECKLLRRFAT